MGKLNFCLPLQSFGESSHELQHARPPCPSPTPRVHPNPCPLNRLCHAAISSSVVPFSSCPQSFPASGSFPMSQLFAQDGQSIRVSASTSVLPMNIQDWSPLGLKGWNFFQSKGLSRYFNTTVQKHSTGSRVWSRMVWLQAPLLHSLMECYHDLFLSLLSSASSLTPLLLGPQHVLVFSTVIPLLPSPEHNT